MLRGVKGRGGRCPLRFSLTPPRLGQRINLGGRNRDAPEIRSGRPQLGLKSNVACRERLANSHVALTSVAGMPGMIQSLSTSGLGPKRQLQCWSDALTDLCGQFAVDPLEASTLEGRINYTTVSKLKLCQIEAS